MSPQEFPQRGLVPSDEVTETQQLSSQRLTAAAGQQRAAERLCRHADTLGFDAISAGGVLAWMMDMLSDGLLSKEDWKGKWIGGANQLRKEFVLKGAPLKVLIEPVSFTPQCGSGPNFCDPEPAFPKASIYSMLQW